MIYQDRSNAIQQAQKWLEQKPLLLDTETTGLDDEDEIVDIAVIDHEGKVLLDTLIKPTIEIPHEAHEIHGISNNDVANAPTFADVLPELDQALRGQIVVIYNRDYDTRMVLQSAAARGLNFEAWWWPPKDFDYMSRFDSGWYCAMELYAEFYGAWNDYHGSYTWQSLSNAAHQCNIKIPANLHRAVGDAELTRLVLRHVAEEGE